MLLLSTVLFVLVSIGSTYPFEDTLTNQHTLVKRSVSLRRSASTSDGVLVRAPYSNWWNDWWKSYVTPLRDSHDKPFLASPSSPASLQLIGPSNGLLFDPAESVVSNQT